MRSLRCPLCGGAFADAVVALRCPRGHSFDLARQGYVNLLTGRAPGTPETPEMVAARAEFLDAGHFAFLTRAVAETAADAATGWPEPPGLVVDVGAGTGHYLVAVLGRLPTHHGLAIDVSKPAARRAARAHSRAVAAVCDAWRGLPLADSCADMVLNIFAPRNGAEFHRVLRPTGTLLVVTPRAAHLAELVDALGLIGVDPDKDHRLHAALGRWFRAVIESEHDHQLELSREDAARLVRMGPSAWHIDAPQLSGRLGALPTPLRVTAAVTIRTYRPLPEAAALPRPPSRRSPS